MVSNQGVPGVETVKGSNVSLQSDVNDFNDSIQYDPNTMQRVFLYCIIHWPSTLLLQLTRAVTKAFKFHWFYKPFEQNDVGVAARALFLQNSQYCISFISNSDKSESNFSLTGPELNCYSRQSNFICVDATYQITMARVMVL